MKASLGRGPNTEGNGRKTASPPSALAGKGRNLGKIVSRRRQSGDHSSAKRKV